MIFDCDGVLVDSEILAIEVETTVLAEIGLAYEPADYRSRFTGLHDTAFGEALDLDCRARTGRPLPAGTLDRMHEGRLACADRLRAVTGAADAVAALGRPKAVASSSSAWALRRKLELCGLLAAFDPHIYSADLVGRGKPHPDIYLHAAQALGVAPAACLALEDSVNGVLSARAASMEVWGFAGGGHMDAQAAAALTQAGASRIVAHWGEARELFVAFG